MGTIRELSEPFRMVSGCAIVERGGGVPSLISAEGVATGLRPNSTLGFESIEMLPMSLVARLGYPEAPSW